MKCPVCGKEMKPSNVTVTNNGNAYHRSSPTEEHRIKINPVFAEMFYLNSRMEAINKKAPLLIDYLKRIPWGWGRVITHYDR